MLVQVHSSALTLYPAATWEEVEGRLRELLRLQPESRPYVLSVTANAVEVTPDKQGRILVPHRLLSAVDIDETALLVGVIDRVEIWNPSRFDQVVGERTETFERFAGQVFG